MTHFFFALPRPQRFSAVEFTVRRLTALGNRLSVGFAEWGPGPEARRAELLAAETPDLRLLRLSDPQDAWQSAQRWITSRSTGSPIYRHLLSSLPAAPDAQAANEALDADLIIATDFPLHPLGPPRLAATAAAKGIPFLFLETAPLETGRPSALRPTAALCRTEATKRALVDAGLPLTSIRQVAPLDETVSDPAGSTVDMLLEAANLSPTPPSRLGQALKPATWVLAQAAFRKEKGRKKPASAPGSILAPDPRRAFGPVDAADSPNRLTEEDATAALSRLAASNLPILVGPWTAEVGFEILYWVPFLRRSLARFDIAPERVVVASRGGPKDWYRGLFGDYSEVLDLVDAEEFKSLTQARNASAGGQKPLMFDRLDLLTVDRAKELRNTDAIDWLHPAFMFRLFRGYWQQKLPGRFYDKHTKPLRLPPPLASEVDLPGGYTVVRFYASTSFPDTAENRRFTTDLIAKLAETRPVVILETGLSLDEHAELPAAAAANVIRIGAGIPARENLDFQTRIIANADLFVGTYGGLSYVAGMYGVPCLAIWSDHSGWRPIHLETADRVFKELDVSFSQISTQSARRLLGLSLI